MTDHIRESYDAMSELYTDFNLNNWGKIKSDLRLLATFAERARAHGGQVADLGCGPGHVTKHLSELGLTMVGYDLSPGLLVEARTRFPDCEFHLADFSALQVADGSFGAAFSRHSLIHTSLERHAEIFEEWCRLLTPGAPFLISFFAAPSAERHGNPFDHAVVTAYELFPDIVADQLRAAGFTDIEIDVQSPPPGARPLDHATILARKATP